MSTLAKCSSKSNWSRAGAGGSRKIGGNVAGWHPPSAGTGREIMRVTRSSRAQCDRRQYLQRWKRTVELRRDETQRLVLDVELLVELHDLRNQGRAEAEEIALEHRREVHGQNIGLLQARLELHGQAMGVGDSGVVADLGVTWSELDVAVPQEPAAQDAPELAILFLVHPIIREHLAGTHDDQPSRLLTLGRRGIPGVSTVEPPTDTNHELFFSTALHERIHAYLGVCQAAQTGRFRG
eukprot:scaffold1245_cov252-Pinguiococcus_pyrenoidosus.AAC.15